MQINAANDHPYALRMTVLLGWGGTHCFYLLLAATKRLATRRRPCLGSTFNAATLHLGLAFVPGITSGRSARDLWATNGGTLFERTRAMTIFVQLVLAR
jgi:hypothetical protein